MEQEWAPFKDVSGCAKTRTPASRCLTLLEAPVGVDLHDPITESACLTRAIFEAQRKPPAQQWGKYSWRKPLMPRDQAPT